MTTGERELTDAECAAIVREVGVRQKAKTGGGDWRRESHKFDLIRAGWQARAGERGRCEGPTNDDLVDRPARAGAIAPPQEPVAWTTTHGIDAIRDGGMARVVGRQGDIWTVPLYDAAPIAQPAYDEEFIVHGGANDKGFQRPIAQPAELSTYREGKLDSVPPAPIASGTNIAQPAEPAPGACKHGSTSVICSRCDAELIAAHEAEPDMAEMAEQLRKLAERFHEGWHDGIEIDASDLVLLEGAASTLQAVDMIVAEANHRVDDAVALAAHSVDRHD